MTTEATKVCQFCAEEIKAAATLCRFCGKEQTSSESERQRYDQIQSALLNKDIPAALALLSTSEQNVFHAEVDRLRKNAGLAYLSLFLTGPIGGHKYYLGRLAQGACYFLLMALQSGFIIWPLVFWGRTMPSWVFFFYGLMYLAAFLLCVLCVIDLVTMPRQVSQTNDSIRLQILSRLLDTDYVPARSRNDGPTLLVPVVCSAIGLAAVIGIALFALSQVHQSGFRSLTVPEDNGRLEVSDQSNSSDQRGDHGCNIGGKRFDKPIARDVPIQGGQGFNGDSYPQFESCEALDPGKVAVLNSKIVNFVDQEMKEITADYPSGNSVSYEIASSSSELVSIVFEFGCNQGASHNAIYTKSFNYRPYPLQEVTIDQLIGSSNTARLVNYCGTHKQIGAPDIPQVINNFTVTSAGLQVRGAAGEFGNDTSRFIEVPASVLAEDLPMDSPLRTLWGGS